MAELQQRQRFRALHNNRDLGRFVVEGRATGKQLGTGSYGSVEEIEVDGLICAGKKIHDVLIDAANAGVENVTGKYVQECQLMSDLRHPNITQFLGVCFLPDCQLPVLLMERLDGSLDDLLETVPNIPLVLKRSILEDVSRGLLYLHKHNPQIIHRDLTAKNVLLTSYFMAKITDLGNSRIVNLQPGQLARTLSRLPGTLVYMPPEALSASSRYGPSLDIFSFGHLALFTLLQLFPGDLLEPNYADPDNPERLMARTEVERRLPYFDQLEGKTLIQLIKTCLHNSPSRRPTAEQLLGTLMEVRVIIEGDYGELATVDAVRQVRTIKALKSRSEDKANELAAKDEEIQQLQQELEAAHEQYEAELNRNREEIQQKNTRLEQIQAESMRIQADLEQKDILISQKDAQLSSAVLQLNTQLKEKDDRLRQREAELHQKEVQIRGKDEELQQRNADIRRLQKEVDILKAQISTHDQVATREYPLQSVADNEDELIEEQALRTIYIEKKSDTLGAILKKKDGNVVISRLVCGGAADHSGMLHPGDILHELNGRELTGLSVDDIADLMKDLTGTIVLKIKPAAKEFRSRRRNEKEVHHSSGGLKEGRHTVKRLLSELKVPLKLKWMRGKDLPFAMWDCPQVVIFNKKVYIGGGAAASVKEKQTVVVYDPQHDIYDTLLPYTFKWFSIAVVSNQLVLIGGKDVQAEIRTNKLGVWNEQSKCWTHPLPPLTTACHSPSVTSYSNRWLVVMGGYADGENQLSRVEILDFIEPEQWYHAASLPQPCAQVLPATIGNMCYLLGGDTTRGVLSKKVLSVCLDDLIQQASALPSAAPTPSPWQSLLDTPIALSLGLAFNGALLAIGGGISGSTAIYHYQPTRKSWVKAGELPIKRLYCSCIVLPSGDLYVAGGTYSPTRVDIGHTSELDVSPITTVMYTSD